LAIFFFTIFVGTFLVIVFIGVISMLWTQRGESKTAKGNVIDADYSIDRSDANNRHPVKQLSEKRKDDHRDKEEH
jgi:hypothetical protein